MAIDSGRQDSLYFTLSRDVLTIGFFSHSSALVSSPPYEAVGGYYREEAIILLRRFYLTENSNGQYDDDHDGTPAFQQHTVSHSSSPSQHQTRETSPEEYSRLRFSVSCLSSIIRYPTLALLLTNSRLSPHLTLQHPVYRCIVQMHQPQRQIHR